MVNMVYGGGAAEEAAAELRAAEATAEGDGGEVRSSVVRKWSFLEDSDDEVRRWPPPPPPPEQCMRAYYAVCRVSCAHAPARAHPPTCTLTHSCMRGTSLDTGPNPKGQPSP